MQLSPNLHVTHPSSFRRIHISQESLVSENLQLLILSENLTNPNFLSSMSSAILFEYLPLLHLEKSVPILIFSPGILNLSGIPSPHKLYSDPLHQGIGIQILPLSEAVED
jgi:hypothetical protein